MVSQARRTFMIRSAGLCVALAAAKGAQAAAPMLDEKDPAASGLGYHANATTVDKAKYPKYAAGQKCANCQFFGGGAASSGPCQMFPGKSVSADGWCSVYNKKA